MVRDGAVLDTVPPAVAAPLVLDNTAQRERERVNDDAME